MTNNQDPKHIGRVRAIVPDVFGDLESGWATPSAPFGGKDLGFFAVPDKDAGVWIEFECGNPEHPIWSGCWWGDEKEMPSVLSPGTTPKVLIKTKGGHSILLDDTKDSASITLQTSGGQKIIMNANGIEISNGKGASIKLSGKTVSINGNHLEVE